MVMGIYTPATISAVAVSGSGAGGELTTIKGPASAELITGVYDTGPTWTTPASLQHTMDVAEGDYVDIHFTGHQDLVSSINTLLVMTILVDDVNVLAGELLEFITLYRAASTADRVQLAFSTRVGPLTGGSRTFKIAAGKYGVGMSNWNLNVGIASYTIFRGGLVPVRQDGVTVLDKPAAFDFINTQVTNVGGVAKINLLGADGAEAVEAALSADRIISSTSYAAIPTEPLTLQFEANEGEVVLVSFVLNASANNTNTVLLARMYLDGKRLQWFRAHLNLGPRWLRRGMTSTFPLLNISSKSSSSRSRLEE